MRHVASALHVSVLLLLRCGPASPFGGERPWSTRRRRRRPAVLDLHATVVAPPRRVDGEDHVDGDGRSRLRRDDEDATRRRFLRTVSALVLSSSAAPASALGNDDDDEGLSLVTRSSLGKRVREAAVRGARVADRLDEKWERLSDARRDQNRCDPATNRRLFDNGFRRDGTRIGNPVLGASCEPAPPRDLDVDGAARTVLDAAERAASSSASRSAVRDRVAAVGRLVGPSFDRAAAADDERSRDRAAYNKRLYSVMRASGELLLEPNNKKNRETASRFELEWGRRLLRPRTSGGGDDDEDAGVLSENDLAKADRRSFRSPFPALTEEDKADLSYDEGSLLDALGTLGVVLDVLRNAGLVGQWEISVPYDDGGEVVTVAVDDDISIGTQSLLREMSSKSGGGGSMAGCLVVAVIRASLDRAGILCGVDSFFIDPSTTKQDVYNPTQLLVNLSNIRTKK